MGRVSGYNQSKWPWHSFVCSVAPEDDQLPLMLSCWCSIDLLIILFFVLPLYTDLHEHFNSYTPGQLFGINLSLFLKRYSKSKLWYFFFEFQSVFWYSSKGNYLFFVSVVFIIIIVVRITCFLFKAINHLLQYFSIMFNFAKYISRIFYFRPQIFFRTDFGSSLKKSCEFASNSVRGYTKMWLNLYVQQS